MNDLLRHGRVQQPDPAPGLVLRGPPRTIRGVGRRNGVSSSMTSATLTYSQMPGRKSPLTSRIRPTSRGPVEAIRRLAHVHKFCEGIRVIRVPARQRRPILDDIPRGPQNPLLIDTPGHIIVRAENVKVSGRQLFDHEVDGSLRRPCRGGLFGAAFGGQSGKDETGDEEMRAKPGAREVPQFML